MLVKIESDVQSVGVIDRFVLKIDGQFIAVMGCRTLEQIFYLLFRKLDRQNAVLEAVVIKISANDGAKITLKP